MTTLPEGTLTLCFCDVERSTELTARMGDHWPEVLARIRTIMGTAVTGAGGVVVDSRADEQFAVFRSARAAVSAATAVQRILTKEQWPGDETVRVRIGLHTGEPGRSDGGYTGLDVVLASRLCNAAHGGQVLLSETTSSISQARGRDLGAHVLKDFERPHHIFQLEAEDLPTEFPPLRVDSASDDPKKRLERAEQDLERRIMDQVARGLERAALPGGKRKER